MSQNINQFKCSHCGHKCGQQMVSMCVHCYRTCMSSTTLTTIFIQMSNNYINEMTDTLSAEYVVFGTYLSQKPMIGFNESFLQLMSIKPNIFGVKLIVNINIPFDEISCFMCCFDPNFSVLFIKLIESSSNKIQICLNLSNKSDSNQSLVFDINSDDPLERYVVIEFYDSNGQEFIQQLLNRSSIATNYNIDIKDVSKQFTNEFLENNYQKALKTEK